MTDEEWSERIAKEKKARAEVGRGKPGREEGTEEIRKEPRQGRGSGG